jgi:DNA polymerase-1
MKPILNNRKLVVIDGNSLVNRAYYAIQRPMMTKDGVYTQAVYGFLNILQKIRKDYEPGYIVVAFDMKGATFRHVEFEDYKAGRKKMPDELAMQIPILKDILKVMKIGILEIEGFEADDIIGTVSKKGEEEGYEPLIITGDKDALQLATHKTKVIITKKGISDFDIYDFDAMVDQYGFTPEQFIDFKGLMGDPSDNIPGIPGVGEKTAQKLVLEYGSVNNLIDSIEEIPNAKLKQRIEDNAQIALMSRRLAEINTSVPIDIQIEDYREEEPDYAKLIELYKKLEFNSFLKKLKVPNDAGKSSTDQGSELKSETEPDLVIIRNEKEIANIAGRIEKEGVVALKTFGDFNHMARPTLVGMTLATEEECFYIDCTSESLLEGVKSLITATKPRFVGHGLQRDYYTLICNGFDLDVPATDFDTLVAQYLLQPGRRNYDYATLILEYFHHDLSATASAGEGEQMDLFSEKETDNAGYSLKWCNSLFTLKKVQQDKLHEGELTKVFEEIELPLIGVLAHMEAQGISVDEGELMRAGKDLTEQIQVLSSGIFALAGQEFNINSPKQLGEILFDKLGLPVGKKTKTGYSTNAEVLEGLKEHHEIIEQILEYRTLTKLNGTYIEGMLPLVTGDGKIHAHFQQTVTTTGRISCTEPNLQNIPIRQEVGRKLRKAFVPESDEWVLVGADYSQIELRVLAHLSQDPALIAAFNDGLDIHKSTAARVFNVPESEVTSLQRSDAKAVNFGVIYGMSSFGLSTELNISRKKAETYIEEYFKTHSKVKEYMDGQISFCMANGYVTTIMNRRRPIPEINAGNYMQRQAGERLAMNSPIQGSAADIIKLAMIKCHNKLSEGGFKSRLILQVHDELIIQARKEELEDVKILLRSTMENALPLSVPLDVELNIGGSWYELN